jgi:hypothetical protein
VFPTLISKIDEIDFRETKSVISYQSSHKPRIDFKTGKYVLEDKRNTLSINKKGPTSAEFKSTIAEQDQEHYLGDCNDDSCAEELSLCSKEYLKRHGL